MHQAFETATYLAGYSYGIVYVAAEFCSGSQLSVGSSSCVAGFEFMLDCLGPVTDRVVLGQVFL
jgi:hypothetical protein